MSPRDRWALTPPKTSINGNTEIEIITSERDFGDLCTEWDDLWRRSPGASVFQTFSCCFYTWQYIAKPAKRKLFCIVARENGAAVFIWPLVKHRKAFWSVIRPLGPSAVEYTQPLAEGSDKANCYASIAWPLLRTTCEADIINLPFTKVDSHLYRITARHSACNVETDFAPYIKWQGDETWEDYYNSLSKGYRRVQNKKRRQLSEMGEVCFEILNDKSQFECVVLWIVEQKRKWGARVNKGNWSNNYRKYLV
jgi:CelD/BcsL family acetyltransferase involved in cellulose biosynthesis